MTRWLKRALLCAAVAGGVLSIGSTTASADERSIDTELAAGVEVAVGADATASVDLAATVEADADVDARVDADLEVGIDLPDVALPNVAGPCSCAGSGTDGDDTGDGQDDDPAVGGDIGNGNADGDDGTDGDVQAGVTDGATDGTSGGDTDQVSGAGDFDSNGNGTGDQQQDGTKDGAASDGIKDGKVRPADDGESVGTGSDAPKDVRPVSELLTTIGDLLRGVNDPIGAGIVGFCGSRFALARHEGLDIPALCNVTRLTRVIFEAVDGSTSADGVLTTEDGSVSADVVLTADSRIDHGSATAVEAAVAVEFEAEGRDADPSCLRDPAGLRTTASAAVDADIAAIVSDDGWRVRAGLDLDVSAALGIG